MGILNNILLFDLRRCDEAFKPYCANGVYYSYILFSYCSKRKEMNDLKFITKPLFEDPDRVLHLDSDKWMEYQLIKHLPPEIIFNHFFGEEP